MDNKFLALIKSKLANRHLVRRADNNADDPAKFLQELADAGEYYLAMKYAMEIGNLAAARLYAHKTWADYKAKYSNLDEPGYSRKYVNDEAMAQLTDELRNEIADKLWDISFMSSVDVVGARRLSNEMRNWQPPPSVPTIPDNDKL